MKRIIFLLTALFFGLQMAQAQDLITTRNGEEIRAKVLEVGLHTVKYKNYSNIEGPDYVLSKDDIRFIKYENGEKDIFNDEEVRQAAPYGAPVCDQMRYSEYKHLYDAHYYERRPDDPYEPVAAGIASYFIPGLGQCISGEWGRGAVFFVGCTLCDAAMLTQIIYDSAKSINGLIEYNGENAYYTSRISTGKTVPMALACMGLHIWNICDAVRVAKIKNMYYQDISGGQSSLKLHIEPYLNYNPVAIPADSHMAAGLSLKLEL